MKIVKASAFVLLIGFGWNAAATAASVSDGGERLRMMIQVLQGQIDASRASIESYRELARKCEAEARECLRDNPPRLTSAELFRAQAREALTEAGRLQSQISQWEAEIARLRAQLLRMQ